MIKLVISVGVLAAALAACAAPTPYAPLSRAGGYSEQQVDAQTFRVEFQGNSQTTREHVELALLRRSAEVTLANGYDTFITLGSETERTDSGPRGGPVFGFGHYGYPSFTTLGLVYQPYGWGGDPEFSAAAMIWLQHGPPEPGNPYAFDARGVLAAMGVSIAPVSLSPQSPPQSPSVAPPPPLLTAPN